MPVVAIPLAPLLGALLAVAAIAKIVRFRAWRAALDGYGLVPARGAVAVAVPALELAVAAGLFAGLTWAAWGAAALLGAFTLVLGAELARGAAPPACACLPWSGRPGRMTLVRNAALIAVAVAAAEGATPQLGRAFWEASYAVLWLGVAALAVLVLSLYRQVGVLHLRLGPRGALEEEGEGPELGAQIDHPEVPARPGDARRVHVGRVPRVPPDRPGSQGARARSRRWPSSTRPTRTRAARSSTPPSTSRARPTRSTSTRRASSGPRAP